MVQNICCQPQACECSKSKCIANNQICIPDQFNNTIQNPHTNPQDIIVVLRHLQIIGVNDKLKEITFNVLVVAYWYDYRLKVLRENEIIYLEWSEANQIWIPALKFFNNLVSVSHYLVRGKPVLYAIVPESLPMIAKLNGLNFLNGSINHIQTDRYIGARANHYKVTLLCDMMFVMFPFDKQECKFEVR